MTAKELILETVEYYKNNDRAVNSNGECSYITEDGNMCAVGRCMSYPQKWEGDTSTTVGEIHKLDVELKEKYRGLPLDLWQNLQVFHDSSYNWSNRSLTLFGENKLEELLQKYA